ncbi:hypothetical protein LIER_07276 [Lithospermum erythrorhizon]|uniref:Protein kinase domain-containing protein n=1 Tax=Lithospermum erythrorhizon TaxID=34254 RepID=A0AAV3PBD6_LITER
MHAMSHKKLIAVAIDNNKGCQVALKWTVDTLCQKDQTILLIHVKLRPHGITFKPPHMMDQYDMSNGFDELDTQTKELFQSFRVLCACKKVNYLEVVLDHSDVAKALIEHVKLSAIEVLVLGAAGKGGFFRFKTKDIPGSVSKGVPDFCSVYVISKGKASTTRSASRRAPASNPLRNHILLQAESLANGCDSPLYSKSTKGLPRPMNETPMSISTTTKSQFHDRRASADQLYELSPPRGSDISFFSPGRTSLHRTPQTNADDFENGATPSKPSRFSDIDRSFESPNLMCKSLQQTNCSFASQDSDISMYQNVDEVEEEMRRLKDELKKTMEMYSAACKEAVTAKQKALDLQSWRAEEQRKIKASRLAEEAELVLEEKEKAKSKAAIVHAGAARRMAKLESLKRRDAERRALMREEGKINVPSRFANTATRYRKYTIDEIEIATNYFSKSQKIGEGGYGPVFKCQLDHTPVAVKVLRPDATEGRLQFQQEVEVLSCIRHPNMVLLLGACPEYGCLVYEYMSNGSLEDRLMQRGNTEPLSWQQRFRIAAEITRALLFLHQTKPEPIVHRDLKPANILLDTNLVSKISDVGLARLVPPSVADSVTQCRMTSAAGTFCYIDPEYQQTGMLSRKSDEYSLGIIYLQILTANPPMGLTYYVGRAIESGLFAQMLDPSVPDWPVEEALSLAKLALKCSKLRRKNRPDLGKVVMPELERLRILSEEHSSNSNMYSRNPSINRSQISLSSVSQSSRVSISFTISQNVLGRYELSGTKPVRGY